MSSYANPATRVVKLPDEIVFNRIKESILETKLAIPHVTITLDVGPEITITEPDAPASAELAAILSEQSILIRIFNFTFAQNLSVILTRDSNSAHDNLQLNLSNLNNTNYYKQASRSQIAKLFKLLKERLKSIDLLVDQSSASNPSIARHYELREAELTRLESVTTKNISRVTDEAIKVRAQLEEEFRLRQEELDKKYTQLREEQEAENKRRGEELDEREKALQVRLKEIDDRESRHARRKIRQDLKEELAKRNETFELTKGTRQLRRPVFWFTVVLLILFGAGLISYSYLSINAVIGTAPISTLQLVLLALKQLAFTAAFASTAVFFIRWNNQWFQTHADEEFRQKRFDLDLDRASWVVEMAMEWKEDKGTEIPPELLSRLTNSLFVEKNEPEQPLHPADQLASALLGASAEANLEIPGGTKLRLDRKSIKELSDK